MRYITKLIKSISVDDKNIPEEEIVQVFLLIKPHHKLKDIKMIINRSKLTKSQKSSLFDYIKYIFIQTSYMNMDFTLYTSDLIRSLPLTSEQKVAIEYELSKYNKQRPKTN